MKGNSPGMLAPRDIAWAFGGNLGIQAFNYAVRMGYLRKNVRCGPEGCSAVYDVGSRSNEVGQIAEAWKAIMDASIEKPKYPLGILQDLFDARLDPGELRLFSPWGPRYRKKSPVVEKTDPELRTLAEIGDALRRFIGCGYSSLFILMPADVYGTEINGLRKTFVDDYFRYLGDEAASLLDGAARLEIKPWSAIREENGRLYSEMQREVDADFDSLVGGEYGRALKTSGFLSKNSTGL